MLCLALMTGCNRADFELGRIDVPPDAGPTNANGGDGAATSSSDVSDSSVTSDFEAGSPANSMPLRDAASDTVATDAAPAVNPRPDGGPSLVTPTLDGATGAPEPALEAGSSEPPLTHTDSGDAAAQPTSGQPSDGGSAGPSDAGRELDAAVRQDSGPADVDAAVEGGAALGPDCTAGTARYPTVQSVIDDDNCPTVFVPAQTFVEDVSIGRDVQIEGVTAASSVIEGTGAGSVASVGSGVTVAFDGITLRGGGGAQGGGVQSAADLSLSDVIVSDNVVSAAVATGGGIYQTGATLSLTNTQILNNSVIVVGGAGSALGGGLLATQGAQVTVDGVHFEGNEVQCVGEGEDCIVRGAGLHLEDSSSLTSTGAGVEFVANAATLYEPDPFVVVEATGAGISCSSAELELVSGADRIVGNLLTMQADSTVATASGAGLFASACSVQVASAEVSDNILSVTAGQASTGYGAGAAITGSVLSWSDVPCSGNRIQAQLTAGSNWPAVGHGGCLSVLDSSAVVTHSTFWNNGIDATGGGGVVFADGGALFAEATTADAVTSVQSCSFGPDNEAIVSGTQPGTGQRASGAAISVSGVNSGQQKLVLTSSTLSGNLAAADGTDATAEGGAIVLRSDLGGDAALDVSSCTLAANTVNGAHGGGELYLREDSTGVTSPRIRNTILADHVGLGANCESGGPALLLLGENLLESTNCTLVGAGSTLTGTDPELGALADNGGGVLTCALSSTSIARDRGPMAGCEDDTGNLLSVDSRGLPRVSTCDLGAFEAQVGE